MATAHQNIMITLGNGITGVSHPVTSKSKCSYLLCLFLPMHLGSLVRDSGCSLEPCKSEGAALCFGENAEVINRTSLRSAFPSLSPLRLGNQ